MDGQIGWWWLAGTKKRPKRWQLQLQWRPTPKTPSPAAIAATPVVASGMNGKPAARRSFGCRSSSRGQGGDSPAARRSGSDDTKVKMLKIVENLWKSMGEDMAESTLRSCHMA